MPSNNVFSLDSQKNLDNELDNQSLSSERLHQIATDYSKLDYSHRKYKDTKNSAKKLFEHPNLASHTIEMLNNTEKGDKATLLTNPTGESLVSTNHTLLVSHPNTPQHIAQNFLSENYSDLEKQHPTHQIDAIATKANLPEDEKIRLETQSLTWMHDNRNVHNAKNLKLPPSFYENELLNSHWHGDEPKVGRLVNILANHPDHTPESITNLIETLNKFKDKSIEDGHWPAPASSDLRDNLGSVFSKQKDKINSEHIDKMLTSLSDSDKDFTKLLILSPKANENSVLRMINNPYISPTIKYAGLTSPALKKETIDNLFKDRADRIIADEGGGGDDAKIAMAELQSLSENPNLTSDKIGEVLDFGSKHVSDSYYLDNIRQNLLKNPNTTPEQISDIVDNLSGSTKMIAIEKGGMTKPALKKMAESASADQAQDIIKAMVYDKQEVDEEVADIIFNKLAANTSWRRESKRLLLDRFPTLRENHLVKNIEDLEDKHLLAIIPKASEQTQKDAYAQLGEKVVKQNLEKDWNISGNFLDLYDSGNIECAKAVWSSNAPAEIKNKVKETINQKVENYVNHSNTSQIGTKLLDATIHFANSNDKDSIETIKKAVSSNKMSASSISYLPIMVNNSEILDYILSNWVIPTFQATGRLGVSSVAEALLNNGNISASSAKSCIQLAETVADGSHRLKDGYVNKFLKATNGDDSFLVNRIFEDSNNSKFSDSTTFRFVMNSLIEAPEEIYSNEKKQNLILDVFDKAPHHSFDPFKTLPSPSVLVQNPDLTKTVLDRIPSKFDKPFSFNSHRYLVELLENMGQAKGGHEQYLPKILEITKNDKSLLRKIPWRISTSDDFLDMALHYDANFHLKREENITNASILLAQRYVVLSPLEEATANFKIAVDRLADLIKKDKMDVPFLEEGEEQKIGTESKLFAYVSLISSSMRSKNFKSFTPIKMDEKDWDEIQDYLRNTTSENAINQFKVLMSHGFVGDSIDTLISESPAIMSDIALQGYGEYGSWSQNQVDKYTPIYLNYLEQGGGAGLNQIQDMIGDSAWSKLNAIFKSDKDGIIFDAIANHIGLKNAIESLHESMDRLPALQAYNCFNRLFKKGEANQKELLKSLHTVFDIADRVSSKLSINEDESYKDERDSVNAIKKSIVNYAQKLKNKTLMKSITTRLLKRNERGGVALAVKLLDDKLDPKLSNLLGQTYSTQIDKMDADEINLMNDAIVNLAEKYKDTSEFNNSLVNGFVNYWRDMVIESEPMNEKGSEALLSLSTKIAGTAPRISSTLNKLVLDKTNSVEKFENILDGQLVKVLPATDRAIKFLNDNPKLYKKYLNNLLARDEKAFSDVMVSGSLVDDYLKYSNEIKKYIYQKIDPSVSFENSSLLQQLSDKILANTKIEPDNNDELFNLAASRLFGRSLKELNDYFQNNSYYAKQYKTPLKCIKQIEAKLDDPTINAEEKENFISKLKDNLNHQYRESMFNDDQGEFERLSDLVLSLSKKQLELRASNLAKYKMDYDSKSHTSFLNNMVDYSKDKHKWIDFYDDLFKIAKDQGLHEMINPESTEIAGMIKFIPGNQINMELVDKLIRWSSPDEVVTEMIDLETPNNDVEMRTFHKATSYLLSLRAIPEDALKYIDFNSESFKKDSFGFENFLTTINKVQNFKNSEKAIDILTKHLDKIEADKVTSNLFDYLAKTLSNHRYTEKAWPSVKRLIEDSSSSNLHELNSKYSLMAKESVGGTAPLDAILEIYERNQRNPDKSPFTYDDAKNILLSSKLKLNYLERMPEIVTHHPPAVTRAINSNTNLDSDILDWIIDKVVSKNNKDKRVWPKDLVDALITHPNISESLFNEIYHGSSKQRVANFHTGSKFNPALFNPKFGRKAFGELEVRLPSDVDGLDSTKGIVPEFVVEPKQITQLKSIMAYITDKIDFKTLKTLYPAADKMDAVKELFRKSHYITPEDVAKEMEKYPVSKYHITYTSFSGSQRHSSANNLCVQLNTSEAQARELAENPKLWAFYQFVQKSANAQDPTNPQVGGHPNTPHSISWIRIDTSAGDEWIVEEFQSDFAVNLHKAIDRLKDKFPNGFERDGHFFTIEDCHSFADRIIDIIGDWDIASMNGIEELAKMHGIKNLYIHGLGLRAGLSGLQSKTEGSSKLEQLYFKNPKNYKYMPVEPSEYPNQTQDNLARIHPIRRDNELFLPYKGMEIPYRNWKKKIA